MVLATHSYVRAQTARGRLFAALKGHSCILNQPNLTRHALLHCRHRLSLLLLPQAVVQGAPQSTTWMPSTLLPERGVGVVYGCGSGVGRNRGMGGRGSSRRRGRGDVTLGHWAKGAVVFAGPKSVSRILTWEMGLSGDCCVKGHTGGRPVSTVPHSPRKHAPRMVNQGVCCSGGGGGGDQKVQYNQCPVPCGV